MEELLNEYREMFHDQFPLMMFMDVSEEKICNLIKLCIKNKKNAYKMKLFSLNKDVLY